MFGGLFGGLRGFASPRSAQGAHFQAQDGLGGRGRSVNQGLTVLRLAPALGRRYEQPKTRLNKA